MKKWDSYSLTFRQEALKVGYSNEEVDNCLKYAFNLYEKKLPIIYDQKHLSLLIGIELDYLLFITNNKKFFYHEFKISKKSGGKRSLEEPTYFLKLSQKWILEFILYKCKVSNYAKGFVPNKSILDNAKFHKNQSKVLTIDIKDFFPSLKFKNVYVFFKSLGYSKSVSTLLSHICTNKGSLPQGSPSSPALSNLLFKSIDKRISGFTKKMKIRYTRYADDLTFSGEFDPGLVIKFVKKVLNSENLKVNHKKTRVREPHQRQEVTGIVINQKLKAPIEIRKELRQTMYYIKKFGLASHLEKINNQKANYLKHLLGKANFILMVDPNDKEVIEYIKILHELLK